METPPDHFHGPAASRGHDSSARGRMPLVAVGVAARFDL